MLTVTAFDTHVEQLFERIRQLHAVLTAAGIPYRIVCGMAVFIHVFERDPLSARLTADVDAAIDRPRLPEVIEAAQKAGLVFRHAAGFGRSPRKTDAVSGAPHEVQTVSFAVRRASAPFALDMLVDASDPRARSAVHLLFLNEKVRPEYAEAVPASAPEKTREGIVVAPVADLVRMKLTSYRSKIVCTSRIWMGLDSSLQRLKVSCRNCCASGLLKSALVNRFPHCHCDTTAA